jgi:light-regulated signal transduction histidine kinase (bacteriophytochrome)
MLHAPSQMHLSAMRNMGFADSLALAILRHERLLG